MQIKKIIEYVRNDQQVEFQFYYDKELWYKTECGLEFPVPITDIGNATFKNKNKAILFMRYIRKHIEMLEEAKSIAGVA